MNSLTSTTNLSLTMKITITKKKSNKRTKKKKNQIRERDEVSMQLDPSWLLAVILCKRLQNGRDGCQIEKRECSKGKRKKM